MPCQYSFSEMLIHVFGLPVLLLSSALMFHTPTSGGWLREKCGTLVDSEESILVHFVVATVCMLAIVVYNIKFIFIFS